MLLELRQSRVAREGLAEACRSILELFDQLAEPTPDLEAVREAWRQNHPRAPSSRSLETVAALSQAERTDLRIAVVADLGYESSLDDGDFTFAFGGLDEPVREAGAAVFDSLYDDVFRDGKGFRFGSSEYANRTTWELDFRRANPEVKICPACLTAELPPPVEGRTVIDADHYLPKETYPPLAVHRLNLTPMCKPCNQSLKRNQDPLRGAPQALGLPDVWFPYVRFGLDEVTFSFEPDAEDTLRVAFQGPPEAIDRAERFTALFGLRDKWETLVVSIQQQLRTDLLVLKRSGKLQSTKEGIEFLATLASGRELGNPRAMMELKFFEGVLNDEDALAALDAQIRTGDRRHRRPSRPGMELNKQ